MIMIPAQQQCTSGTGSMPCFSFFQTRSRVSWLAAGVRGSVRGSRPGGAEGRRRDRGRESSRGWIPGLQDVAGWPVDRSRGIVLMGRERWRLLDWRERVEEEGERRSKKLQTK
jgi:hypothetical protein